jgi:type 1 fimbria pilin
MTTCKTSGRLAAFAGAAVLLIVSLVQPAAAGELFNPEAQYCDVLTTDPEEISFGSGGDIHLPNTQPPIGTVLAPVVTQRLIYSCGRNMMQYPGHEGNTGYSFDFSSDSGILNDDLYDDGTNVVFESGIAGVGMRIVVASIEANYAQAIDPFWGERGPSPGFDIGRAYANGKAKEHRMQIAPASALSNDRISGVVTLEYSLVSTDRYVKIGKSWGEDVGAGGGGRLFRFSYADAAFWSDAFTGHGQHCRNFRKEWYQTAKQNPNILGEVRKQVAGCLNQTIQANILDYNIFIKRLRTALSTCALSFGGGEAVIGGPYKGNYTVELSEVSTDEFGGKGSTAGSKEVSLRFTCPFQKKRGYLLNMSDLNDSTSNNNNVLALARDTPEPAAAGVGVQIRLKTSKGTEVLRTKQDSTYSMDLDQPEAKPLHKGGASLIVEYIKTTTDPIKPGNVKADALLSIVFK